METEQSLKQKKIALAQSEHASIVIELIKDCISKNNNLVADTEWKTIKNTITFESEANLIIRVSDYIDGIRNGMLHEPK